jgi:hypothetical protein
VLGVVARRAHQRGGDVAGVAGERFDDIERRPGGEEGGFGRERRDAGVAVDARGPTGEAFDAIDVRHAVDAAQLGHLRPAGSVQFEAVDGIALQRAENGPQPVGPLGMPVAVVVLEHRLVVIRDASAAPSPTPSSTVILVVEPAPDAPRNGSKGAYWR